MPKLWTETVESHRREVRDAILDATAALVEERGPLSVTMSEIAGRTGIGRATLYKYFPDVETIVSAWHERQVNRHFDHLAEVRDHAKGGPADTLEAVLEAFALISSHPRGHHEPSFASMMHRHQHVLRAEDRLRAMVEDLLIEGSKTGDIRRDVLPTELASYCLHALTASAILPSETSIRRLVQVIMAGLRPQAEV